MSTLRARSALLRRLLGRPDDEIRPAWLQAAGLLGWVLVGLLLSWSV